MSSAVDYKPVSPARHVVAHSSSLGMAIPFIAAAALYLAISGWIIGAALHLTGGHFIYALDDPYITMAIAKNLAVHGVWGVTPYAFSSASSTPLFALLLAGVYRLLGVSAYSPLALSWIFGLGSIGMAARMLSGRLSLPRQTVALVALVLFPPLFAIGTLGMEHSLHVLLTLLFLRDLEDEESPTWRLALVTALMVATRYEGLFFAGPAVLLLLRRHGSHAKAIAVCVASILPVALYALVSRSHHGYWLPNSIALKGLSLHGLDLKAHISRAALTAIWNAFRGFYLSLLLAGMGALALALRRTHRHQSQTLGVIVIAGCLHLMAADLGWAYRYEDYLIAAAVVCVALSAPLLGNTASPAMRLARACFLIAGVGLAYRAVDAMVVLPRASRAIYAQQWQMAAFLRTYYPHGSIAANDIGAINFETDIHCLDLVGLASAEVFSAKHAGRYSTESIERIATQDKVQFAIVYDSWFTGGQLAFWSGPRLPSSWVRVEQWRDPHLRPLGSDTVSFYAVTPNEIEPLRAHLAAFRAQLPPAVIVGP